MTSPIRSAKEASVQLQVSEKTETTSKNFGKNILIGVFSGVSVVPFVQPMIFFKNYMQSAAPQDVKVVFSIKKPQVLYRGGKSFASSFAPVIAIQTAVNGILAKRWDPIAAATASGAFSAIAVCPFEGIMIQQQRTGQNFWATVKNMQSSYGFPSFYRAFLSTAIREGSFSAAYLGVAPKLTKKLQSEGYNYWVSQYVAGILAGTVAAVVSQPFDTHKTQQQQDFSKKHSLINLFSRGNAMLGLKWRIAMISTATIVMSITREVITEKLNC
ncbi:MAG: MC/SLC25 family protein [Chlamydiota bacterium]|jgi:hypothetical protein